MGRGTHTAPFLCSGDTMAKPSKPSVVAPQGAIQAALKKKFGAASVSIPGQDAKQLATLSEFISTGIDVLDMYAIGRGGLPVGRMSEIVGFEGSGKTAFAYAVIAKHQRAGGVAVLFDAEHAFDHERAVMAGIDLDTLIMCDPSTLEEWYEQMHTVLDAHDPKSGVLLMVTDTIAALCTKRSKSNAAGDGAPKDTAAVNSEELKKLHSRLHAKRAHCMILNQIRTKFGVRFGNDTDSPGGKALKFYCSVRLQYFGGKAIKDAKTGDHTGKVVTIMVIKNRMGAPFRKPRVRFDYDTGYNNPWTTIQHAKRLKLIDAHDTKGLSGIEQYKKSVELLGWSGMVGTVEHVIDSSVGDEPDLEAGDDDDNDDDC